MVQYKQKCTRCRKNYVLVKSWKDRYPVCYDCDKKEMDTEITDPKMKRMFNIPEELYKKSKFLRSIKINHIRYGELTPNQIKTFKKTVKDLKNPQPEEKEEKKKPKPKKKK
ncbi:hypothetical protein HN592_04595 [Candidatus Woesearchaeota archaeon]|jgi:hypothetical protein|nr:hypothetical protein [Candidatus Woesearchaeota archaeon]MBT4368491.1 hypothetical protein [Candidatus Woesearchaeota archaeon]MBT4712980.1 hypothetical protein [Candidatus Woesearchaeota archaeon]MBT6639892.1 hypothetical protein [Candidatus Woesearchaeota archaeon]MBT7134064.1 hypothetical protein [Candidatus Woesearchaeota archaeon]